MSADIFSQLSCACLAQKCFSVPKAYPNILKCVTFVLGLVVTLRVLRGSHGVQQPLTSLGLFFFLSSSIIVSIPPRWEDSECPLLAAYLFAEVSILPTPYPNP